jgi:glycine cleavage system H protein
MRGAFAGINPILDEDACVVKSDPYEAGWLYAVHGEPEPDRVDAEGYLGLLRETITRMAAMQHNEEA